MQSSIPSRLEKKRSSDLGKEVVPASSEEGQIIDGASFPKCKTKKRRVHHSPTPMDITFLRRSSRTMPSAYRRADPPPPEPVRVEGEGEADADTEVEHHDAELQIVLVESPAPLQM